MSAWYPKEPDFLTYHAHARQERDRLLSRLAYRAVAAVDGTVRHIVGRAHNLLDRAICEYRARRDLRTARQALLKLDDRLLRDIGLTPADVQELRWTRQPRRSAADPLPVTDIALEPAEIRRCGGLRLAA